MAYRIPIYQRRLGPSQLPNVRVQEQGVNLQPLVQGVGQAASGIDKAVQNVVDRADAAAVQAAKVKAAELRMEYERRMDESHGTDVLQRGSTAPKDLEEKLDELGGTLNLSSRAQQEWQRIRDSETLGFRRSVNGRVVRETEVIEDASFAANLKTNADKAATLLKVGAGKAQTEEFKQLVEDTNRIVDMRAAHRKLTEDVAKDLKRESLTPVFAAGIDARLDSGDWKTAQALRDAAEEVGVNQSKLATFDKAIKAKRLEEVIEDDSELLLKKSGNSLHKALEMVEGMKHQDWVNDVIDEPYTAEEKTELRDAIIRKHRDRQFAMKEKDSPTVAILASEMLRNGRSPYSAKMVAQYDSLEPEQKAIVDAKWHAYKRSRKTAKAEDRRAQHDLDQIRRNQLRVHIMDGTVPDIKDPTETFYKDVSPQMLSTMEVDIRKAQGMDPDDRRFVNGRVDAYILKQGLTGADARVEKQRISAAVTEYVNANHGKFEAKDLRDVVERAILTSKIEENEWRRGKPFVDTPEEQAQQEIEDLPLDVFNAPGREGTNIPGVDRAKFQEVRQWLADQRGVAADQVSDTDTYAMYEQLRAKGRIK